MQYPYGAGNHLEAMLSTCVFNLCRLLLWLLPLLCRSTPLALATPADAIISVLAAAAIAASLLEVGAPSSESALYLTMHACFARLLLWHGGWRKSGDRLGQQVGLCWALRALLGRCRLCAIMSFRNKGKESKCRHSPEDIIAPRPMP